MRKSIILMILLIAVSPVFGQGLLKKAKEKVNAGSKILRDIKGNGAEEGNEDVEEDQQDYPDDSQQANGRPTNKKGKKLSTTTIDVAQEIANAQASLGSKDYGKTRNSIQQAMLGIEVAMAYNILETLPENVLSLNADKTTDNVEASGAGYSGLTVTRDYYGEESEADENGDTYQQYLQFSLINSSVFTAGITAYIANPTYSSDQQGDKKVVQYKGINSLLAYDEYSGYTLSIPLGDNTLVQFTAVNFDDENEVLKVANVFDTDKMKSYLGEK